MYCPKCQKEREFEIREENESYPIRNETIRIIAKITYCKHCGEQIWNDQLDDENLKTAYRKFRMSHSLLQPEEIKKIRQEYALSQTDFGRILGLGDKTIARYENGSIQDQAPNNLIMLAGYPDCLELLLIKNRDSISSGAYIKAMEKLSRRKVGKVCNG